MRTRTLICLIAAITAGPVRAEANDWVSLFDGKTLDGWKPYGDGKFTVEDGAIVCEGTKREHGWLISDQAYGNFLLKLRFKWVRGNTGIQFRSAFDGKDMVGYQADLDLSRDVTTGTLHEQGGRRMLQAALVDARKFCKPNDWNEYEIFAVGDHMRLKINGAKTADFHDPRAAKGILAFQAHAGQDSRVLYKDIRILELPAGAKWTPLFNGKDLTGWHEVGQERWSVEGNAIVGKSGPKKGYGWLVTNDEHANFILKFTWRWHGGNSGVQFRSWLVGEQMHGYQADFDPATDVFTGMIYDEHGEGRLAVPPEDFLKNHVDPDGWNTHEVSAIGTHLMTHINGALSAQVNHDRTPKGIIALQVHSGGPVHVEWKDLEILTLPD
jgi:hypothetical protein